jgi:hypothetical protein
MSRKVDEQKLSAHPTWSFNTINQQQPWSDKTKTERKGYHHYQKCKAIANYKLLKNQVEGFTINFCCGLDTTGDVKVDVDLKTLKQNKRGSLTNSDFVLADIRHLPFIPLCCDTLLSDPPFKLYARFKWILELKDLARKKVIISHPCTNLKLHGFTRELYFINSKSIFLRLWWVYTRES